MSEPSELAWRDTELPEVDLPLPLSDDPLAAWQHADERMWQTAFPETQPGFLNMAEPAAASAPKPQITA